jgi:hypothetical protein
LAHDMSSHLRQWSRLTAYCGGPPCGRNCPKGPLSMNSAFGLPGLSTIRFSKTLLGVHRGFSGQGCLTVSSPKLSGMTSISTREPRSLPILAGFRVFGGYPKGPRLSPVANAPSFLTHLTRLKNRIHVTDEALEIMCHAS